MQAAVWSLPKVRRSPFTSPQCLFLSYVHFVWQTWNIRDILRSETTFCVTCTRYRRGAVRHWQAWVNMRGAVRAHFAWQAQYLVNLEDALKVRKSCFLSSFLILDMMMILCGRCSTSDASSSFRGRHILYFVHLDKEKWLRPR